MYITTIKNSDSFASSFPISCLIAVARISNTMLNKSGDSGQLCLVLDLREKSFSFSSLRMMLAVGLSYIAFIMLRYVPSIPTLLRVFFFYHKQMLNFVKNLFHIYWDNHVILFFNLLMWCITVIGFADIEPSCHPWDKSHWIMVYDPFDVPLNLLCYCFFEDFCIYVHQRYWPVILFFCDIFVWFWYQGDAGLVEWVQKCFFRASLVAQWLRICLPMQGTRVRALVWEDPTCRGATRPVSHKCWACASGA